MQRLKCVIVDDEEMAVKVMESLISNVEDFEIVGTYFSGVEAFLDISKIDIDVLFLDIQMPKMTGLSMLKMLKNPPLTVLTTAHRNYAIDGFDLDVVDYLLKPIGLERFLQTVQKIRRNLSEEQPSSTEDDGHLFIRTNRTFVKIHHKDIFFVEAIKNHIRITSPDERLISLISLTEFHQKLPSNFLRIHRSFLINTQHISRYDGNTVGINEIDLPIGKSFKEKVRENLKQIIYQ